MPILAPIPYRDVVTTSCDVMHIPYEPARSGVRRQLRVHRVNSLHIHDILQRLVETNLTARRDNPEAQEQEQLEDLLISKPLSKKEPDLQMKFEKEYVHIVAAMERMRGPTGNMGRWDSGKLKKRCAWRRWSQSHCAVRAAAAAAAATVSKHSHDVS